MNKSSALVALTGALSLVGEGISNVASKLIGGPSTNERHGKPGLWSRIKAARLRGDSVTLLLAEGEAYKFASEKTKRKWLRAAGRGA